MADRHDERARALTDPGQDYDYDNSMPGLGGDFSEISPNRQAEILAAEFRAVERETVERCAAKLDEIAAKNMAQYSRKGGFYGADDYTRARQTEVCALQVRALLPDQQEQTGG